MPEGPERTRLFMELHRKYGLTEYGLAAIANNHRKKSGRDQLGAHEAQCIGKTVWRALERYLFSNGGKPRFKRRKHGLNSISGTDNHEIIYRPKKQELTITRSFTGPRNRKYTGASIICPSSGRKHPGSGRP